MCGFDFCLSYFTLSIIVMLELPDKDEVGRERKKEMEARVSVGIRYLIRVWGETRE